ncbi:tyrosine-protein phosphatase [Paenibacillus guangzhouensis]|uniref:tyrosine-protein phosphatase n=1 Tax=Paenibacillus guangzhouensis TaxID=1473112 RepID=UPI001D12047D|nr:CpsB/CapC family capsule biosynthesis tyrosine phosphatase [Paenibacillus guangzhouensis]
MIDTHCHILPNCDDGPKTSEGSIRMAQAAVRQGIHTIIATPHHATRKYNNASSKIIRAVRLLNAKLKKQGIPLTVLPGQEFRLTEAYRTDYRKGRIQTLAGTSYLLVELPSRLVPDYFMDFLAYMNRHHTHIIIAHPERNFEIIKQPAMLQHWLTHGVLLQVTTQSLVGYFGKKIQETAKWICKKQWAHLIASDAHDPDQRKFYIREGSKIVVECSGATYLSQLHANAAHLIRGRRS